ncbi:HAD family hydrolase [Faecalitalea cylindroides]|uniref:HAD family hydrolase n=1 Tax=Faecalitalea cylindroides TaxID=39483 RepID=UPI0003357DEF|nr:HAD family phosphatase [Faecalitalea cylindroides]CDD49871.1 haloacid dehalogenase superfamily subfamily IA variant 3 with third motif having DD or ED [Firmicutes bacterium CAG:308]
MKAVIFDMDGVLIDSEALHLYDFRVFLQKHNQNLTNEELSEFVGLDAKTFIGHLQEIWKPVSLLPSIEEIKEGCKYPSDSFQDMLVPHVRFILSHLKKNNIKIAIASSSPYNIIYKMLSINDIDSYFDVIVSGNDVQAKKPSPDIYFETLKRLELPSNDCIVIEDSLVGIQAAINAGLYVIAVKENRFLVDQSQADCIVNDLIEAWIQIAHIFDLSMLD